MIRRTILGLILGFALASGLVEAWNVAQNNQAEITRCLPCLVREGHHRGPSSGPRTPRYRAKREGRDQVVLVD